MDNMVGIPNNTPLNSMSLPIPILMSMHYNDSPRETQEEKP
jgi:hypothetical protein